LTVRALLRAIPVLMLIIVAFEQVGSRNRDHRQERNPVQTAPGHGAEVAGGTIACALYPAIPDGLQKLSKSPWRLETNGDEADLDNEFSRFRISLSSGLLRSVTNKLTHEAFTLSDYLGFEIRRVDGSALRVPSDLPLSRFRIDRKVEAGTVSLTLTSVLKEASVTISYQARRGDFWLERRIQIEPRIPGLRLERLTYGRFAVTPGQVKVLTLGKFDRPRLVAAAKGGVFAGLGWWFYHVDDQAAYENREMNFELGRTFMSEPWYVGVFRKEEQEPYAGWLWYRTFLQFQKSHEAARLVLLECRLGPVGYRHRRCQCPEVLALDCEIGNRLHCFRKRRRGQGASGLCAAPQRLSHRSC
jgi:hypothetical protein